METNLKPTILLCEADRDNAARHAAFLRARHYVVTVIAEIDLLAYNDGVLITYDLNRTQIDLRLGDYVIAIFDGRLVGDESAPPLWKIIPWLIEMGIPCWAIGSNEEGELMQATSSFSATESDFESFVERSLAEIYASAIAIRN